ncbi:MAG: carbohydrate ABC transporter permease [Halocynthiibacter sp.]
MAALWLFPVLAVVAISGLSTQDVTARGWWRIGQHVDMVRPLYFEAGQRVLRAPVQGALIGVAGSVSTAPMLGRIGSDGAHIRIWQEAQGIVVERENSKSPRRVLLHERRRVGWSFDNFRKILINPEFISAVKVSGFIAVPAALLTVLIGFMGALSLTKNTWGRSMIDALPIFMALPIQIAFVPVLALYVQLGLARSFVGVWAIHVGLGLPFVMFVLAKAMRAVPPELGEIARLEGASGRAYILHVLWPSLRIWVLALAGLQFMWVWNDLLITMVFFGQEEHRVALPLYLRALNGTMGGQWGPVAAALLVQMCVPVLVLLGLGWRLRREIRPHFVGL